MSLININKSKLLSNQQAFPIKVGNSGKIYFGDLCYVIKEDFAFYF